MNENGLVVRVESGDLGALEEELETGKAEPKQLDAALLRAVQLGRMAQVQSLLEHGADVSLKLADSGWSLLHVAAECGHLETVRRLVVCGAEIDAPDNSGASPLHVAVDAASDAVEQIGGRVDVAIVKLLLELGADPALEDQSGATPLDWAADANCEELETMLRRGRS